MKWLMKTKKMKKEFEKESDKLQDQEVRDIEEK